MEFSDSFQMTYPVVIEQSAAFWPHFLAAAATLAGAFLGAWYGGKRGYEASLKAGLHITRQSKLEECLSVIYRIERLCSEEMSKVVNELRAGRVAVANELWGEIDLVAFSRDVDSVKSLMRLHIKRLDEEVDRVAMSSHFILGFGMHLSRLHPRSNEEEIKNHCEAISGFSAGVREYCAILRESIEAEASTDR